MSLRAEPEAATRPSGLEAAAPAETTGTAAPFGSPEATVGAPPDANPIPTERGWGHRHLLDVAGLDGHDLDLVMRTADEMRGILARPIPKVPTLRGLSVTILFYEASTRTRVSFEVAAKNLSADVVNIAAASSSVVKGESLIDTVRTVEALGADMLVMRHGRSGAPDLAARVFGGHVVNAGDGWHAHPTQALLDLYTLRDHVPGGDLRGRKVVIVGDILHSRVARSNIWSLTTAGADLWLCGPATLLRGFEPLAAMLPASRRLTVTTSIEKALAGADAVMALRLQQERMSGGFLPSLREYAARYQLNAARMGSAAPEAIVLHPGPMNEGVEIAPDLAAGGRSVITEQVANGVAIRMAVLYLLAGGRAADATGRTPDATGRAPDPSGRAAASADG